MTLEEKPIWTIAIDDYNNGNLIKLYHFSSIREAHKQCKKENYGFNQTVVEETVWMNKDTGKYYRIKMEEVSVDTELIRNAALAKLTEKEITALGLKRP